MGQYAGPCDGGVPAAFMSPICFGNIVRWLGISRGPAAGLQAPSPYTLHFSDGDVFLTEALSAEALECANQFLLLNNYLLTVAVERQQLHYGHVTKHHMMWHIADMSKYQNPKVTACFEFEDFMGKVKKCAQASMAGSSLPLIGCKVLECFLLALHLRLQPLVDM